MAFEVVTIADRISQYPDRRRLTKEDGSSELVTVAAEEGSVSAEGTEWGAAYANDLETRIDAETHLLEGNFGTVETTTTASKAYAVGDCLVLNGQYYKVIAAISQGATLVVGTNIAVHSVSAINSNLSGLTFAQSTDGKWGYKVAGADPVIPFKTWYKIGSYSYSAHETTTNIDISSLYSGYANLTIDNFKLVVTNVYATNVIGGSSFNNPISRVSSYNASTGVVSIWNQFPSGMVYSGSGGASYDLYILL